MKLDNFRQFYGQQEIEFAGKDARRNVTVIYGANGMGKTSLYRALMFCLYGIKKLAQDSDEQDKDINLVNKIALKEAANEGKKEVESSVEIEFFHSEKRYTLRRSILGIEIGTEIIEQFGEVSLSLVDEEGNAEIIEDIDEISSKINDILDKRMREYFLFDGEKIEKLTRVSQKQIREVKTGIKNLMGIDKLSVSKEGIDKLLGNVEKQLKNNSTGEYRKQLVKLEKNKSRKTELEKISDDKDKEMRLAENELEKMERKLREYEDIKDLLIRRDAIQKAIDDSRNERNSILQEMISINDDVALLLFENEMIQIEKMLNEKIKNKEIPSPLRESLIDRILEDEKCICGRAVDEHHSEGLEAILEWKNRVINEQVENCLIETYRGVGKTLEYLRNKKENVEETLQKFSVQTENIEKGEHGLSEISDEIGDRKVDPNILKLEESREKIIKKKGKLEQNYEDIQKELNINTEDICIVEKLVSELEKKEDIKNILAERRSLAKEAKDALNDVYDEFTKDVREKISRTSTEIFMQLIDEIGRKTFSELRVVEDYSLQLYDKEGKAFLSNISAGQRQVTSIAFITALAGIAGGREILEIPLFMDTPFGRLSGEHRDRLIFKIPQLTKQWILLATDTEFSKEEARKLRLTGRWGKIYCLEGDKAFITHIKQKNVETFIPIRTSANN